MIVANSNLHMRLGSFLILSSVVGACGPEGRDYSEIFHTAGQTTNNDFALKWYDVTEQERKTVIAPLMQLVLGSPLPIATLDSDSEVTQRLQYWLDAADERLRGAHPEQLANVPAPKVQVILNDTPNGFVMPIPVCLDVRVDLPGRSEAARFGMASIGFSASGKVVPAWNRNICVRKGADRSYLDEYVAQFNAQDNECKLELSESLHGLRLQVGESCQVDNNLEQVAFANRLVVYPTSNLISVHAGLLNFMNELQVVSVLMHELGHYYKSHPDRSNNEQYDFFYEIGLDGNHNRKPEPDESLAELGNKLTNLKLTTRRYRRVEGQNVRSELYLPLLRIISRIDAEQLCDDEECNQACRDANKFANSWDFRQSMGRFPFARLANDHVGQYKKFEELSEACLADVNLVEEVSSELGSELSYQHFAEALLSDPELLTFYAGMEIKDKVWTSVLSVAKAIDENEKQAIVPLKQARELGLGYFTVEQEADDLAVEWMMLLGYDERPVVETNLFLGKFVELLMDANGVLPYPTAVSMSECERLYRNDWLDEAGNPVRVPVADFVDNHHSSCFRAFNIAREVRAHNYVSNPDVVPIPSIGGDWSAVQEQTSRALAEVIANLKANILQVQLPPQFHKFHMHDCRFAHLH